MQCDQYTPYSLDVDIARGIPAAPDFWRSEVGQDVSIEEPPRDESEEHEANPSAMLIGEEGAGKTTPRTISLMRTTLRIVEPGDTSEAEENTTDARVVDDGSAGLNVPAQTPQGARHHHSQPADSHRASGSDFLAVDAIASREFARHVLKI
ncbi:hypothetical protein EXIGLDRAFT_769440 [Exidia glandulosa HHB12029]|uniref:Uncharacterized protein n=1 Tax=Exidia glandulosa HHB12029 TaxID=1314781 RepID=A0A165HGM3_EXIGL|nr:hypothetical protein EXIGLDRAFT_769440 [Exidia glandulosa HHB12029]